jgi:hypothetical protein
MVGSSWIEAAGCGVMAPSRALGVPSSRDSQEVINDRDLRIESHFCLIDDISSYDEIMESIDEIS